GTLVGRGICAARSHVAVPWSGPVARSRFALIAALLWAFLVPGHGYAAVFSIPAGDVGALISAITTANGNGQANTINLAAGVDKLAAMHNTEFGIPGGSNGRPPVAGTRALAGPGAAMTVIERSASAPAFRILHVQATGTLTLSGLTIRNG